MDNKKGLIEELLKKEDMEALDILIKSKEIILNEIIEVLISLNNAKLIYNFMIQNYKMPIPYDLLIKKVIELKDYKYILEILKHAVTENDKKNNFIDFHMYGVMARNEKFEDMQKSMNLLLSKRNFELTLFEKNILNNLSLLLNALKDCENLSLIKEYAMGVSHSSVKMFLKELILNLSPPSLYSINSSLHYENNEFDLSELSPYQQEKYLSYIETISDERRKKTTQDKKYYDNYGSCLRELSPEQREKYLMYIKTFHNERGIKRKRKKQPYFKY